MRKLPRYLGYAEVSYLAKPPRIELTLYGAVGNDGEHTVTLPGHGWTKAQVSFLVDLLERYRKIGFEQGRKAQADDVLQVLGMTDKLREFQNRIDDGRGAG